MNEKRHTSNVESSIRSTDCIFQYTPCCRRLSNKVRNEHDQLQPRWTGNTFCNPPCSIMNTNLKPSINHRCHIVRMPLNASCNLQQTLRSPHRKPMPCQHQPCNNPRDNSCTRTSQPSCIRNTTNNVILQRRDRFIRRLIRSLDTCHQQVRFILGHLCRPLPLGCNLKLFCPRNSHLRPQIDRQSNTIVSRTAICRTSWNTNRHTLTRLGVFFLDRHSLCDATAHSFFVAVGH
mmetsp:Transcript_19635/g.42268  ORF Transcript_19635/g.42268 Transcript_19635/m.42268 type:complete len:233 (+) Transcript_19635:441-1139(+)